MIMDFFCRAPASQLRALDRRNVTHVMYSGKDTVFRVLTKADIYCTIQQGFKHNYVQNVRARAHTCTHTHTHARTHARTHAHTHTQKLYRLRGVRTVLLFKIFRINTQGS